MNEEALILKMEARIKEYELLQRFRDVHGDKYDYSNMNYINVNTPITICCPVHGEFTQKPIDHYKGKGCNKCARVKMWNTRGRRTTAEWIRLFNEKHNNKYDYSLNKDIRTGQTEIEIICKQGHHFSQKATRHLRGDGCPYCANSIRHTKEQFVERANKKFNSKFKYIGSYINNHTNMLMECPEHGLFEMTPRRHLVSPYGCPECSNIGKGLKKRISIEDVKKRLYKIFGDRITLKEETYTLINEPCEFVCKEHGDFTYTADKLLHGGKCPSCNTPLGESIVFDFLKNNGYKFKRQFRIDISKLFGRRKLRIDFMVFIENRRYAIEVNGDQHYKQIPYFHDSHQFSEQQERDNEVRKWCKANGVKLIEIRYSQLKNIKQLLTKKLK